MIAAAITTGCALSFLLVLWNVTSWPAVKPRRGAAPGDSVSVLIPARDEEANLARCIETVLIEPVTEVLIYDDDSTDATPLIIADFMRRDGRVRSIPPEPLPQKACGKPFACSRLAAAATGNWLFFLDADARLAPGAVAGLLAEAAGRHATLLSCWPRIAMHSLAEQILMPLLNFVVFTAYPAPLGMVRRSPSLGLAHGACILVAKTAYDAIGGHAAVASEIFEDTRLARLWRERGQRSLCLDGRDVVSVRMYSSVGEIWYGFLKNFRAAFKTSAGFWSFLLLHAFLFIGAFFAGPIPALLVISMRVLLALRFRQPLWSALLHAAAECFLVALGIASCWRWRAAGAGVVWKGRIYRRA